MSASLPVPPPGTRRWTAWAALGVVYVVWGSTYLAIKISIETLPPLLSAGARFLGAGVVMVAAIAVLSPRSLRMTRAQATTSAVAGVLLLLGGNGMVVLAEERLASGLAALLVSTTPLWIVLLRAVLGDRPSAATVAGVGVGFAGVAVLLLPGGGVGGDVGHGLLVVGAALSWAAGSLLTTRRPVPENPFVGTAVQMVTGGTALTLVALARGELRGFAPAEVSGRSWVALVYLVVAGSLVAFTAYVWVLRRLPVSTVSTYAYVNPVLAVLLGAVLLDEPVGLTVLAGGVVIVGAVALVVTAEARRRRPSRGAAPGGDAGEGVQAPATLPRPRRTGGGLGEGG